MKKVNVIFAFICSACFLYSGIAFTKTINNFLNSNSRAMSMAGAFTSVYDIDNSPLWNPSISILEKDRVIGMNATYSKVELDILPVGIGIVILALDQLAGDSTETNCDMWKTIGILTVYSVRGLTYSGQNYQFYLKLNEDLLDYDLLDTKRFFDNSTSMAAFSCQFSRELAAGVSLNYFQTYRDKKRKRGLGGSIGLSYNALAVDGLSYGLTYFKFPDHMKDVRRKSERLFDNSLNLGISYHFQNTVLMSLDLRDITHVKNKSFMEAHLGLEEKLIEIKNGHLYFRQGGFFLNNHGKKPVWSLGMGYRSDMALLTEQSMFNLSFGVLVNKYQRVQHNVFFSLQMNL